MRSAIIFVFLSFLSFFEALASPGLTDAECRAIVKDLESLSNVDPHEVEAKAPEALALLRQGETLPSYFIAYNIYVENLFNKGKVEKARQEIEQMLNEALALDNKECKVIALRTQGQFYYKLGLYDRASDCFRRAMELCPRYDSELLENCFTWSSTLFWLVQSYIHTGHPDEAARWLSQMDDMMQWLDSTDNIDHVGYKPVMIRGLKAKIELMKGNEAGARDLIQQCPPFIRPDIPSRAYVEYFVARMLLCVHDNRHEEALPLLDELIEMHISDYKPIAAEYLYQKGLSLAELRRFEESTKTLREYIAIKDGITRLSMAQQLDELNTRYEVEKLHHERDNMHKRLQIALGLCAALAIIISLIVASHQKLRRKNRTLAHNISELNRLSRQTPAAPDAAANEAQPTSPELVEAGNRIAEYIDRTRCYLQADCNRNTIKEGLGVTDHILAKAIVAATGMSFVNYINELRLKVSIEMLEDRPEMTINDVAAACGFGTVRQFQRLFKQRYGLSPSAYKAARKSPV